MKVKNQQGGALIEVIVAMLLLAVLVTGINAGIMSLIKSNITSKELASATSVGYKVLEELRREPYSSLTTDTKLYHEKYKCLYKVSSEDGATEKEILLTVSWPAISPRHKIQLSTIIAEP